MTDKYNKFKTLSTLLQIEKNESPYSYSKIMCRGNFELHDYNRGFLSLKISVYNDSVGIVFSTIDDGSISDWKQCKDNDKARSLCDLVASEFEDLNTLPNIDEVNNIIKKYGLFLDKHSMC